jgi:hypothetical protein
MIEETIIASQVGQINLLDRCNPVYRVRYGKKTKILKEHKFLGGIIKFYTLIREDVVWDDYFVDYDILTGEVVDKPSINKVH